MATFNMLSMILGRLAEIGPRESPLQTESELQPQGADAAALASIVGSSLLQQPLGIPINQTGLAVLQSKAIVEHSKTLPPHMLRPDAAATFASDVDRWMTDIFQLPEQHVCSYNDGSEGLLKVIHVALRKAYPSFETEGYRPLYTRPPSIYYSAALPRSTVQMLHENLSLPNSTFVEVPCEVVNGVQCKMQPDALAAAVAHDMSEGNVPVLVIAMSGAPVTGVTDDLEAIHDIVKKQNIWIHVVGDSIAAAAEEKEKDYLAAYCHSFQLTPSVWFGLPGAPNSTIVVHDDESVRKAFTEQQKTVTPTALPLWVGLKLLGQAKVKSTIKHRLKLVTYLKQKLSALPNLVSAFPESGVSPIVAVRYTDENVPAAELAELNRQLWINLKQEDTSIGVGYFQNENVACFRYAPIELGPGFDVTEEELDALVASIASKLSKMEAARICAPAFRSTVAYLPHLSLVDAPGTVGLGAVQYVPAYLAGQRGEEVIKEVNDLNQRLCRTLAERQKAAGGIAGHVIDLSNKRLMNGTSCVAVGLPENSLRPEDVPAIVRAISQTASQLEDNQELVERMTKNVQAGILKAQADLQHESDARFSEEMLLNIPVVGSVLSWLSPADPANPKPVKGKKFTLEAGAVEDTALVPSTNSSPSKKVNAGPTDDAAAPTADAAAADAAASADRKQATSEDPRSSDPIAATPEKATTSDAAPTGVVDVREATADLAADE